MAIPLIIKKIANGIITQEYFWLWIKRKVKSKVNAPEII